MSRPQISRASVLSESLPDVSTEDLRQLRMVRHEQLIGKGVCLETLHAIPRHVLDRDETAVHEQQEVVPPVANDDIVGPLDHARQGPERAGKRAVRTEKTVFAADAVIGGRSVDSCLDVAHVEVVVRAPGEGREAHLVPEVGAEIDEVVEVKTGIHVVGCGYDVGPDVAAWQGGVGSRGNGAGGRPLESVGHKFVVAAFCAAGTDVGDEAVVQIDYVIEVLERLDRGC